MEPRYPEFRDKVVVITGAAGIFGRWIAAFFAREGAKLCLSDIRAEQLKACAAELGLDDSRVMTHQTELMDEASILDLTAKVGEKWQAPHIVINNAGLYPKFSLMDMAVADWDRIFGVNLRAPFLVTRAMAKLMIAQGIKGSIINISSGAARQMRNGSVPYSTSKTALERLTKGYALELAGYGIRVNAVEPGFAPGSEVSTLDDDYITRMKARIPLGRTSEAEDAASAIAFLCSDKATFITGTALAVDGGNSIGTFESGELGAAKGVAKR